MIRMSKCSCGCAEGKCECKPGCKCGCNHKKGGASWAQKKSFEKAWGVVKYQWRDAGRFCEKCNYELKTEDYTGPFDWSYDCPECGFEYRHGRDNPYGDN